MWNIAMRHLAASTNDWTSSRRKNHSPFTFKLRRSSLLCLHILSWTHFHKRTEFHQSHSHIHLTKLRNLLVQAVAWRKCSFVVESAWVAFLGGFYANIMQRSYGHVSTITWLSRTPTLELALEGISSEFYSLRYCTRVGSERSFHAGSKQANDVWVVSSHRSTRSLCVELTVTANPNQIGIARGDESGVCLKVFSLAFHLWLKFNHIAKKHEAISNNNFFYRFLRSTKFHSEHSHTPKARANVTKTASFLYINIKNASSIKHIITISRQLVLGNWLRMAFM